MESQLTFNIPIAKPCFSGQESEAIRNLLERGWVTQGPLVEQFEKAIADLTGARFAVATTSCTTALHLTMLIHGIGPGDDVICPSYSFVATANAIRHSGAVPKFVDINPNTLNLDPDLTERFIQLHYDAAQRSSASGNQLKAILLVHQIGLAADIDAFKGICAKYDLALLEDSACGIGSSYKGRPLGGSGNTNVLSFHPRKVITTGEGGMILTSDERLANRARSLRSHGASTSDFARHQATEQSFETYSEVGYNYRMTDIQACIGLKQIELLPWLIERRNDIASRYDSALSKVDGLDLISKPGYQTVWNRQSYPVRFPEATRQQRDDLMRYLQECGIAVRRGIPPIHLEPAYQQSIFPAEKGHDSCEMLSQTELVSNSSLFIPLFPQMTDDEVDHVINSVVSGAEKLNSPAESLAAEPF